MTEQNSYIDSLGNVCWEDINGLLHREDGPAVVRINGTKEWYFNGKLHRTDGPAVEFASGSKEWHIDGKFIYGECSND